ncbi:MAG: hypothetical protein WD407_05910 [Rhodospirillales bacterium]
MYRVDNATSSETLPASTDPGPNPDGYFTGGDPQSAIPATKVPAEWLNMLQEELANVITGAGVTLDKANRTQLRTAIANMIAGSAHAVVLQDVTFEGTVADGDVVLWDSGNTRFAKATADGTANDKAVGIANVTDSEVIVFGETPALFAGLTPGGRYYLHGSTAGEMTETAPPDVVKIGIAKAADTMFVDIDRGLGGEPADIPFIAGYDSAGAGKDLAVQVYGSVIVPRPLEILSETGNLATEATDADCIVDIEKNGVTIYSSKPQFDDGENDLTAGTLDGNAGVCAAGDVLVFKVTQVGSTVAGQRLVLTLLARYL